MRVATKKKDKKKHKVEETGSENSKYVPASQQNPQSLLAVLDRSLSS